MNSYLALEVSSLKLTGNGWLARFMTYGTIVIADLLALCVAVTIAVTGRELFHAQHHPQEYLVYAPGLAVFGIVFCFSGLYPGIAMNIIVEFRLIIRSVSIGFLLFIVTTVFLRGQLLASRMVLVGIWALAVVLIPTSRRIVRGWCCRYTWWGIPTVILAEETTGRDFLEMISRHPRLGLRPIAVLTDRSDHTQDLDRSLQDVVQGPYTLAKELARPFNYIYAVIAAPSLSASEVKLLFDEYIDHFSSILVVPDLFGLASLSVPQRDIGGVLALQMDNRLSYVIPRFVKRLFDITISGAVLIGLLPLFFALYASVRLSSKGPAFYGHVRVGHDGARFRVWKFRSMVQEAEAVLQTHLDNDPSLRAEWEATHKLMRDPRVTAVGNVLRRFSLDELPQIWNVFVGEMSLVGPRPIVQSEVHRYGSAYNQYCRVKPGITGLWQISGRNNTTYELRTQIDDYYVRNWSMSMDLFVLVRTVKAVLLPTGAY